MLVDAAECGVGNHREERSAEVFMKASMTEELSSVQRFIIGGGRLVVISRTGEVSELVGE